MQRFCPDCGQTKPIAAFHRSKLGKGGFQQRCYACHKAKYLVCGPENHARRNAAYRRDLRKRLLSSAKARSITLDVPFDLSIEDIVVSALCPVLGIPLQINSSGMSDSSPTIDRRIPSLGYIRGNVVVISWLANKVKSNLTDPAIFEKIAAYLRDRP